MSAVHLYNRPSPQYARRVAEALQLLTQIAAEFPGRVVLSTSMGVEDMVLIDLLARHQLPIALATLDTGALHPETLELIQRTRQHYGVDIEVFRPPVEAVADFVARHGADAPRRSVDLRHACCRLRKLEPLERMLASRAAWITGLRREQSAQRQRVELRQLDSQGRVKLSPLAEWSQGDVWNYVAEHGVPYNPLHDLFYPSIGCAPCTRAVALGEDVRAGRWWWEQDGVRECGLHLQQTQEQQDKTA